MNRLNFLLPGLLFSVAVIAGGNPEFVPFPEAYKSDFTNYDTRNRAGKPQVAMMYANKTALDSVNQSELADGSTIVMEVYKAVMDENGEPVLTDSGVYEKGKLAAIAVMEKRTNWDAAFNPTERNENWGYAIYNVDATAKDNNLDCAGCHQPYKQTNYMFSHPSLVNYSKQF